MSNAQFIYDSLRAHYDLLRAPPDPVEMVEYRCPRCATSKRLDFGGLAAQGVPIYHYGPCSGCPASNRWSLHALVGPASCIGDASDG